MSPPKTRNRSKNYDESPTIKPNRSYRTSSNSSEDKLFSENEQDSFDENNSLSSFTSTPVMRRKLHHDISPSSSPTLSDSSPASLRMHENKLYPKVPQVSPKVLSYKYERIVADSHTKSDNFAFLHVFVAVLSIAVLAFILLSFTQRSSGPTDVTEPKTVTEIYAKRFQELKERFVSVEPKAWKRLKGATATFFNSSVHSQPLVLFYASGRSSIHSAGCFAGKHNEVVASIFTPDHPSVLINISELSLSDADQAKLELDDFISNSIASGSRVFTVLNLHHIPPRALSFFHSLCDHETAPYKDAVFSIVYQVGLSSELTDGLVEDEITQKWNTYLDEYREIQPLLSRIANNKILMGKLKDHQLNSCL